MRDLFGVMANEWMKLFRRRRFLIVAVLSLCVVALFGLVLHDRQQNQLSYNPIAQTQNQIQYLNHQVADLQKLPANDPQRKQLEQVQQELAAQKQSLERLQALQTDGSTEWRASMQEELNNNRKLYVQLSHATDLQSKDQAASIEGIILKLQYSLDHNVAPLGWQHVNPYEQVQNFFELVARVFLPLLVVILVSDMVSGEATDGTIKLLLVRPVSRAKILLGKWIVSLTATVLWTIAVCATLLVAAFAVVGTKGAAQPVITNVSYTWETAYQSNGMGGTTPNTYTIPHYGMAHVLPDWQFILYGTLFIAVSMAVVATITFLCSTLFRSAMVSTAAAMGSVIIGFIVMNIAKHQHWVTWLFSTHLDLTSNWTGSLATVLNQGVSLTSGILVLIVWAVVALCVSFYSFTQRDVLNA